MKILDLTGRELKNGDLISIATLNLEPSSLEPIGLGKLVLATVEDATIKNTTIAGAEEFFFVNCFIISKTTSSINELKARNKLIYIDDKKAHKLFLGNESINNTIKVEHFVILKRNFV